jgi:hypothetical protein
MLAVVYTLAFFIAGGWLALLLAALAVRVLLDVLRMVFLGDG